MTRFDKPARSFDNLPVARKFVAISLASTFLALLLACTLSFHYEKKSLREQERIRLATLTGFLERETVSALRADNSVAAQGYLESLSLSPDIESLQIFTPDEKRFAAVRRDPEAALPPAASVPGIQWQGDRMIYTAALGSGQTLLGSIQVELNIQHLEVSLGALLWRNFAIFAGGLALAWGVVRRLQRRVTRPLSQLVEATRDIAERSNFDSRIAKVYDDEFGAIADNVNNTLETIRLRNESLRRVTANLERAVEKRTEDINQRNQTLKAAIEAAQAAARVKSDFLATTSHELRTPLNPIIGYVDRLLEKSNDAESTRELEIIKQSAELLLRLIDDILDFTRVERGDIRLQKDEINLQKCFEDVLYLMQAEADKKDLEVELKFDLPQSFSPSKAVIFESDEGRLKQVLFNLVSNAIKFTDAGSVTVFARIHQVEKSHGRLHVSVKDTGIGISEKEFGKLFKPFSQIDAGFNRKYRGMGLGLAISRSFIEAMGGTLDCSSVEGEGSVFWFDIPVVLKGQRALSPTASPLAERDTPPTKDPLILLVDDEPLNRELGASMIESLGYEVASARDGYDALEQFAQRDFDLVLLDIRMPRLDGFDTAEAIRKKQDSGSEIPVIALSAHITEQDAKRCREVGINDYLQKPLNRSTLNELLKKWLAARMS